MNDYNYAPLVCLIVKELDCLSSTAQDNLFWYGRTMRPEPSQDETDLETGCATMVYEKKV